MLMELANRPSSSVGLTPRESAPTGLSSGLVGIITGYSTLFFGVAADDRTPFERERAAFEFMLPGLGKYSGHFVAVHNGQVVDSDLSRNVLVRRFFRQYDEGASLYVGFVGVRPKVRVPTPFFHRAK